jgi:hypothetical protein
MLASLVYEWHGMAEAKAQDAIAQHEYERTASKLKEREAEMIAQTQSIEATKKALTEKQAVASGSVKVEMDPVERGRRLLATYPELKEEFKARSRAMVSDRYYSLYNELHLTDEQIAAFEETLGYGWGYSCSIEGIGSITLKLEGGPSKDEIKQHLIALLGKDGYQRYKNFADASIDVNDVAAALYYTDEPLTAEQGRQLARAMAAENSRAKKGVTTVADYFQGLETAARGFLSEAQLAGLQQQHALYDLWWAQEQYEKASKQK